MTRLHHSTRTRTGLLAACCTVLAILAASCGRNTPYDSATDLILERRYDEAAKLLGTIPPGDSLRARADMALLLCAIGTRYDAGDVEAAARLVDSAVTENDVRRYVLNIPPTDSLYRHGATLAMLSFAATAARKIDAYLQAPVNEANRAFFQETANDPQLLWSLVMVTLEGESYQPVDADAFFGGSLADPPWMRSVRFDRLCVADAYRDDADKTIARFTTYKKAIDAKAAEYRARFSGLGR
jgi:hypothetical protein